MCAIEKCDQERAGLIVIRIPSRKGPYLCLWDMPVCAEHKAALSTEAGSSDVGPMAPASVSSTKPPAGEGERIEHREGIFEVYDHEGRYQGCIGSEKWAALVQADRAEGREAERVNRWSTRVRDTEEGGEREWLDPERLSSLEAVAEAAREVLPPSPHLYRRGPTKALWEALARLDAVSAESREAE